ncbi:cardiolipin synthase [Aquibacillus koreensis]|uniref:Cardiolipin synthase n=1 Tax=Aquibacillus koreensis TaxID=279446 RepID=A0A9X4AIA3_9BACI|nr:cardiolipin synthase [Aquibacillus koreensis]MCT2538281.1 cardiolipin synthase [Aquibacillus koreensis]MDC3420776.1 cardiolipin synthase [Aquibacillus koreensis]
MILLGLLIAVIVFVVLLLIDYELGKRAYQKKAPVFDFGKNQADRDLFTNGDALFSSLFEDIKQAKKSIDMMFFIIRDDSISRELYHYLEQKALDGVKVRLVADYVGSFSMNKDIVKELEASGVQFVFSDRPAVPYFFYRLNRRNHRKITIIDDEIAYVGGFNVGTEYMGNDLRFGKWRDYHLRMTGEVVGNIARVYQYDWNDATKEEQFNKKIISKSSSGKDKTIELVVTESGQLEEIFLSWINQATHEILIGTPYFIPSKKVFQALVNARERGVELHILVPIKADHPLVKPAAFPYYKKLLDCGANLHLYTDGFYHAKIMIIDESFCDIGTANFDMRSIFLNKEINTTIDSDPDFISHIRQAYFHDLKSSNSMTHDWINKQPLKTKISAWIAYCVRPLL